MELFFSSSGRLGRAPFVSGAAVVMGLLWLCGGWGQGWARTLTGWAVGPLLLFCAACLVSRRLHDMGRAGWWAAYPVALLVAAWPDPKSPFAWMCAAQFTVLAVWLAAMPGQRRANGFGPPR